MLLSLSWLREFTPYDGTAETLGDKLTMLGLELEDIVRPFDDIADIRVGEIVQCLPHPDSDHLHCCKVDVGDGELLDIVCGAPNVATGQKAPVALVGTRLPNGMIIKKAKLRGQPSMGMICSERELGLSDSHEGILVLPDGLLPGSRMVDALGLDREVLDISITPNRADCLSVLGLARETAMAFHLPLHVPDLPLIIDNAAPLSEVPVEIAEPELCWLYSGRVITGVQVAPSPLKMRYRLHAVGVRAISNIVDVTNYILFECGQPLHSFDLDKLAGGRIVVRPAKDGECFTTLDGKERILSSADLCICDAKRPVGLAGVMGGQNTEITSESRNIFLESAVFRPQSIRATSRRLGLISEASYRFERGIDQRRTLWALDRACALMVSVGGGFVRKGFSVAEPRPFIPLRIPFRPARANALLGVELDEAFCVQSLEGLGCAVEQNSADAWTVIQPSWRHDLTREADLVEEVGRIYGLDTIEPVLPAIKRNLEAAGAPESRFSFWARIREWGAGLGLNEAVNYSFVGHEDLNFLRLPQEGRISIMNPLSADQDVLRTALAPGLLRDLRNNLAQGAQGLRLFELATIFEADPSSETTARETGILGILLYGRRHDAAWPHAENDMDYADLKGLVANLLAFLHLPEPVCRIADGHPFLLPCVDIFAGSERAGVMGRVLPAIAGEFHARKPVWLAELNLETLRRLHEAVKLSFKPLPTYPPVRRDITVMARPELTVGEIVAEVRGQDLPLLEDVFLVDCFEPESGKASGERHLTFRLVFRHAGRTLNDAEVDKLREKVAESLCKSLGVRI